VGILPHRDYDVRVGHKAYRLRLVEEGAGSFSVEVAGRKLHARLLEELGGEEFKIEVNGREYRVKISRSGQLMEVLVSGRPFKVEVRPIRRLKLEPSRPSAIGAGLKLPQQRKARAVPSKGAILSPIPGKVVALKVREGDRVRKGDVLLIVEAMKMENEIRAPRDGTVKELLVSEGSSVSIGQPLLVLD